MPIPQLTLAIIRSDNYEHTFILKDAAGDPLDITGATVLMDVRAKLKDDDPLFTLTELDDITVDGPAGSIALNIPPAKTGLLPDTKTNPVWDLETTLAGIVRTVIGGDIEVTPDVSRT